MLHDYYQLAKPGIVYGNLVSAIAGFFFATGSTFSPISALALVGLGLVIGSACVFNNYFDRDMDAAMERTQKRGFAAGTISPTSGIAYGAVLGAAGILVLWMGTNPYATVSAVLGFAVYVGLYTPLKRITQHATLVGAVAGAMPIVVGYAAATSRLDSTAFLLFLIIATWQMPHFYAIALYRMDEYAAARVPVVPLVRDAQTTIILSRIYIVLFALTALMPSFTGATGITHALLVGIVSAWWLSIAFTRADDVSAWGKRVFHASLIVLVVTCIALALRTVVP
jgi:protoheme IX farnesyltransferase